MTSISYVMDLYLLCDEIFITTGYYNIVFIPTVFQMGVISMRLSPGGGVGKPP